MWTKCSSSIAAKVSFNIDRVDMSKQQSLTWAVLPDNLTASLMHKLLREPSATVGKDSAEIVFLTRFATTFMLLSSALVPR
eukprot:SM000139S00102  [mRNA]  locus=s139:90121:90905:+ [translate_table: standard]